VGNGYLEDKNEFLIGNLQPNLRVGQEDLYSFISCPQPKLQPGELGVLCWKFRNIKQSSAHSRQLSSPTIVGTEIACITPANGVQSFDTKSFCWAKNPPLLDAAKATAISLNRNLVVQTKDSIQIFSFDILKSGEACSDTLTSHIYPLGKRRIISILQPTRQITLLKLGSLRELHPDCNSTLLQSLTNLLSFSGVSSPTNRSPFVCVSSSSGSVAELDISLVLRVWQSGAPLPKLAEAADEDVLLSGLSPQCTRVVTIYNSPRPELRVKDARHGTILASHLSL